ncbi:mpv17-like protein [Drosophila grimshawi]|uniref:Mitochondrial inner membrane protein Mpv17 n=1 Tax=Drosophila grimshawi TaxID=7222 RepID=B4JMR7_DROGR|nr:mpv17-like protein [Drosophila grimshawi]EDV92010.1 GH24679 [Drosophila grimshawi]
MALRGYLREGLNAALIMGAGDAIAQLVIEKKPFQDWDIARTARFTTLGLVFVGPALRKWYGTLDTFVSKQQSATRRGLKKMIIDQSCFAPPFTLVLSYVVPCINGEQHGRIVDRIKENYLSIMQRNYMLWPMAQTINFSLMPIQYQVIFAQIVAVFWNCYLSTKLNER